MWQNSNELFEYALRELQAAIINNKEEIQIVLTEHCEPSIMQMREIRNKLQITEIVDKLRKQFAQYNIRSIVALEGKSNSELCNVNASDFMLYPLIWILTLQKKK